MEKINVVYKQPCEVMYHVFTNGTDEYVENYSEAVKIYREYLKENNCARLYKETNWDEKEGLFIDEECLLSMGEFPY